MLLSKWEKEPPNYLLPRRYRRQHAVRFVYSISSIPSLYMSSIALLVYIVRIDTLFLFTKILFFGKNIYSL